MDGKDIDRMLSVIGKKLETNINDSETWAAKADLLCSIGLYENAVRCCDKSLTIDPDNAFTWATKGNALDKLGKHEEAQAAFAKAKELGYIG